MSRADTRVEDTKAREAYLDDLDRERGAPVTRYGHAYPCDCQWCSRSERQGEQIAAFRREI
jgi:hypothetical protein